MNANLQFLIISAQLHYFQQHEQLNDSGSFCNICKGRSVTLFWCNTKRPTSFNAKMQYFVVFLVTHVENFLKCISQHLQMSSQVKICTNSAQIEHAQSLSETNWSCVKIILTCVCRTHANMLCGNVDKPLDGNQPLKTNHIAKRSTNLVRHDDIALDGAAPCSALGFATKLFLLNAVNAS